ncbi:hypothetical protein [Halocatena salina]|uniref:Uncharacterized protein n=1 Tax=Halocatena salina TaxID=2934340 RepID=A0A8U0A7N9_9EURY|nr:hypothetical protein [Halocatena salina]UPM45211.1 hypothetical protein MW046_17835 [Halocatena salina]
MSTNTTDFSHFLAMDSVPFFTTFELLRAPSSSRAAVHESVVYVTSISVPLVESPVATAPVSALYTASPADGWDGGDSVTALTSVPLPST